MEAIFPDKSEKKEQEKKEEDRRKAADDLESKPAKETLVELFLDPTGGHGLGGDIKSLNRYRKYEDFLLHTVGSEDASF